MTNLARPQADRRVRMAACMVLPLALAKSDGSATTTGKRPSTQTLHICMWQQ